MFRRVFRPGEVVVYRKRKFSRSPGPRAKDVRPQPRGDDYCYTVDKYWLVVDTPDEDTVVARTRRGKEHRIKIDDDNLRHAWWWEKLLFRGRFQELRESQAGPSSP